MSGHLLGVPVTSLSADKLRSSPQDLRHCLTDLARRGEDVWTGPLDGLVDVLVEVARIDLCLARLVEGHSDGLRILSQAGAQGHQGVYGVWASRSVGTGVRATKGDGAWRVNGELRFASGVDLIDRALVPAWLDEDRHVLVDLPAQGCGVVDESSWQTTGMDAARTFGIHVDVESQQADLVGPENFYLERPGFVVGGLCVAAVWAGGAQQVLDAVAAGMRPYAATPHQQRRIGVMEQAVWQARSLVESTVARVGRLDAAAVQREIALTRTAVVQACDTVLAEAPLVVGPAGLSRNPRLARVVQDLGIYVRQHHLDAELTRSGQYALDAHELLAE